VAEKKRPAPPPEPDADDDRVTLVDDEGNEHAFTLVGVVEVDQQRYAVLLPEEDPEEGAYVFRLESDADGEDILVNVEDDEEFDRVVKALESQEDLEDDWESDDEVYDADEDEDEDEQEGEGRRPSRR